jgi:uncharacterized MnhB-related membrane protein
MDNQRIRVVISIILILIVMLSGSIIFFKRLITSVVLLSGISLLTALVFYIANAPDVAITEAAVGTGLSTIAFLWVLRATKEDEKNE